MGQGQSGHWWLKVLSRLTGAGGVGGGGRAIPAAGSDPTLAQQTSAQHVFACGGRLLSAVRLRAVGEGQPLVGSVLQGVLFIHTTASAQEALLTQ